MLALEIDARLLFGKTIPVINNGSQIGSSPTLKDCPVTCLPLTRSDKFSYSTTEGRFLEVSGSITKISLVAYSADHCTLFLRYPQDIRVFVLQVSSGVYCSKTFIHCPAQVRQSPPSLLPPVSCATVNKDLRLWAQRHTSCWRPKILKHDVTRPGRVLHRDIIFSRVHTDIKRLLPRSNDFTHILTAVVGFICLLMAAPIKDFSAKTVAEAFVGQWIVRFGVTSTVMTDRDTRFHSGSFRDSV
ncbi:hypothetical protein EG68_10468 [Paragonimus skrjabini miyazakii]|uniref:Integrase catalytic domain-containing protein n=1 Tax=Paragonimus skrjabini miyazakii TaxID=59628 RepID=A0A8S9YFJ5_9TREM|nr:hypothetical protein EG68_10468 [Paragonimus skrjabini miyazakii]